MTWLFIFMAAAIYDAIFACWSDAVARKEPSFAAIYAAGIMACSGFVTVNFVADPWLLIPACSGAFVGTYITVRRAP
jgi:hypothetical protein